MKNLIITSLLTFSISVFAFDDNDLNAHVHGLAKVNLINEADLVDVQITSPLMNLVGFEYAPRTEAEINAIRAMVTQFETPHHWLQFDGNMCKLISHAINQGDEHIGHDHPTHTHTHEKHHNQHAELEASYRFKCQSVPLDSMTVSLQNIFPAIESLSLSWIVGTQSGFTTLDHDKKTVYFKQ